MCELLGVSITPGATMGVYFKAFRPRAEGNQSGWGVGWYESGRTRVIKEAARADESQKALALIEDPPASHLFVIHVRRATVGAVSEANTHPFCASLRGREWLFAHNGTVQGLERLAVNGFTPIGETDSEVAFHYLLTRLQKLEEGAGEDREAAEILDAARELSRDGKVNFLLTDGRNLYAYHDGHTSVHFLKRDPRGAHRVHLADESDYVVDLEVSGNRDERAVIVASVPLTNEPWTKLHAGDFLICRDGSIIDLVSSGTADPSFVSPKTANR